MSQQLDAQGEAHNALGTAVSSYGQRVLNDPHILGNLVTDLLPDLPRERSLLVTGADAGIAAQMTQHVEEQHIDPDTAVQLVARALSERRAIDQAASMWVATEYAQALGYRVRPHAEADQSTQPQVIAAATATMSAPSRPPMPAMPTMPPGQSGAPAPQAPPGQSWPPGAQAPQAPPGQSWPPGAQAPQAPPGQSWPPAQPPGQSWPPAQPPSGRPPTSGGGRKRGLIAAGTAAGLVVIFFLVAAVAGIAPFSKAHPQPTPTPTPTPAKTTHSPSALPTAAPTLAAGVTPISQLLPRDIADPTTQCSAIKKPGWSSPGLVTALACNDTDLPNGYVYAYQMDNRADYNKTWSNFNSWSSFNESTAGSTCPPASSGGQGLVTWHSRSFPTMQGQVVECWTGSNAAPIYVWSLPSQDAFFFAVGADGSSFKALDNWWGNYSGPANPPTATPSPQTP